jgi:DNA-binding response OmpR family regulator
MTHSLLLVDDEPLLREALAEFLKDSGFELLQASGEEEALGIALERKPDVVISDLNLGSRGSGLSLFSKLKKELGGADEPCCILITGFGTLENAVAAIRAGVDDYLVKPVKLEELSSALRGGVARRRFRSASLGDPGAALAERFYHEVSAPLTVLRAYLDMFAEGRFGPLAPVQEAKMEVLRKHMGQVLGVLRGFHHHIDGEPELGVRERLDPLALFRDVQQAFFLDFERRGVNVASALPPHLPMVEADRRQASMLMEAMIGKCLADARFGMTLHLHWVRRPNEVALQFRLEPWNGEEQREPGIPSFAPEQLASGGLALDFDEVSGLVSIVFLHPIPPKSEAP